METIPSVIKRGRAGWDKVNMPATEFQGRVGCLRQEMVAKGLDSLLVYGNGVNHCGNVCYISNFAMDTVGEAMVIIPPSGEPVLLFEGTVRSLPTVKAATWLSDVRSSSDIVKESIDYLNSKGLLTANLGLVNLRELMPYSHWNAFQAATVGAHFTDAASLLIELRLVKSPREAEQMRRSSRLLQQVYYELTTTSLATLTERQIEAITEKTAYRAGATDFRLMLAATDGAFHPASNLPLPIGVSIHLYTAVEFERYWTAALHTFFVQPSRLTLPETKPISSLFSKIAARLQPGKPVSRSYAEIAAVLKTNGGFIAETGLGEGIGLELEEYPILDYNNTAIIKEGAHLFLQIALDNKKLGQIRLGHTVQVNSSSTDTVA